MNNLKKAVEVKEQMDKKRLDYIKSLDFDTLYNDIADKLDRIDPGYTNLIIKTIVYLKRLIPLHSIMVDFYMKKKFY